MAGWFGAHNSSGLVHNVRVVEELFGAWSRVVELFGAGFDELPERVEEGLCELAAYTWLTDMVRCCFAPPTECDRYLQLNMMLSTAECARYLRLKVLAIQLNILAFHS